MNHISLSSFAPLLIDAVASADRAASFGEGVANGEGESGTVPAPPDPKR